MEINYRDSSKCKSRITDDNNACILCRIFVTEHLKKSLGICSIFLPSNISIYKRHTNYQVFCKLWVWACSRAAKSFQHFHAKTIRSGLTTHCLPPIGVFPQRTILFDARKPNTQRHTPLLDIFNCPTINFQGKGFEDRYVQYHSNKWQILLFCCKNKYSSKVHWSFYSLDLNFGISRLVLSFCSWHWIQLCILGRRLWNPSNQK